MTTKRVSDVRTDEHMTMRFFEYFTVPHEFRKTLDYHQYRLDRHGLHTVPPKDCSVGSQKTRMNKYDGQHGWGAEKRAELNNKSSRRLHLARTLETTLYDAEQSEMLKTMGINR